MGRIRFVLAPIALLLTLRSKARPRSAKTTPHLYVASLDGPVYRLVEK